MRVILNALYVVVFLCLLAGCATPVGKAALRAVGMADKDETGRKLKLVISAGGSVNSDRSGRGNAVVLRLFKLRNADNFQAMTREAFESGGAATAGLKEDLISSKEQILTPGQQYQLDELLPPDTRYLGLVMSFQSPQPVRWRAVLPVSALDDKPLLIGVHRCSFTITEGLSDKELLKTLSRAGSAACS
ncbi:type VI secretion system lipoprotein TssJ [Chitinimonas sp. PSY-7]|uniref:type VI secretion system lipoprotein TssJ n=1 Tax=Chitinimonas sp. PSY-7 TaxID=3459088 RepID=UPI00403FDB6D